MLADLVYRDRTVFLIWGTLVQLRPSCRRGMGKTRTRFLAEAQSVQIQFNGQGERYCCKEARKSCLKDLKAAVGLPCLSC